MVQAYVGDDRHPRFNYIGAVQPAAHPHFHHRKIHGLPRHIDIGDKGLNLELCHRAKLSLSHVIGYGLDLAYDICKVFLGNHPPVDLNAFADIVHIRRQVDPRPVASFLKDGGDESGSGALAVGPGDVYHSQPLVRVAERTG